MWNVFLENLRIMDHYDDYNNKTGVVIVVIKRFRIQTGTVSG